MTQHKKQCGVIYIDTHCAQTTDDNAPSHRIVSYMSTIAKSHAVKRQFDPEFTYSNQDDTDLRLTLHGSDALHESTLSDDVSTFLQQSISDSNLFSKHRD